MKIKTKTNIAAIALLTLFLPIASEYVFGATTAWSDVSGQNGKNGLASSGKANETDIVVSESEKIYAAFQDKKEQIVVRGFDRSNWSDLADHSGLNYLTRKGRNPTLATKGEAVYAAYADWQAGKKARVKKWDGSNWSDLADADHPLGYISDLQGFEPVLCFDGSGENLYAAFRDEANGERIKVMKWNDGSGWSNVSDENNSDGLVSGAVASEADIKASKINDDIFIAFEDRANGNRIQVKKWNGTSWQALSDENHPDGFANSVAGFSPSIDTDGSGNLHLAYTGNNGKNTYVHKWNGVNWEDVGGGIAVRGRTIESTIVVDARGYAYLAYSQKTKSGWRMRLKVRTGNQWVDLKFKGNKNISRGKGRGDPSLAVSGNTVYASYTDARQKNRARVKMLNFEP